MDPAATKQQIAEKVRQASNILVTVNTNPTVDQLAACIGLTLLLNKMEKHATAVFSGQVPSTLEFLQPERTIETNTDSLRDFIISLDKEKADKLRYKVEDQVVKIYITPYKTSLSEKDLVFGQGEYNVDLVLALGIRQRTQIDTAITAHGRILHDATVVTINTGPDKAPDIGQINWMDATASSLCEMLVSISENFGSGLLDNQISTALLTGIVAETNRFSNNKTSPKVMTMSAQLMAAGANQQLIVTKLSAPVEAPTRLAQPRGNDVKEDGTLTVAHNEVPVLPPPSKTPQAVIADEVKNDVSDQPAPAKAESDEIHIDEQGNLQASSELIKPLVVEPIREASEAPPSPENTAPKSPLEAVASTSVDNNAPIDQAAGLKPDPTEMPGSHTLLNPEVKKPFLDSPFTANTEPEWENPYDSMSIDPLNGDGPGKEQTFEHKTTVSPTGSQSSSGAATNVDDARSAVEKALSGSSPPVVPDLSTKVAEQPPITTPSLPLPAGQQPPSEANKAPGSSPQMPDTSAPPPPIPPPLVPSPGVVIPSNPPTNK